MRSHVHLQWQQRCPISKIQVWVSFCKDKRAIKRVPGLHSSPCCSFSPAYTSMHQAWKAKAKRSSKRDGGLTAVFRRFNHSWHCSKVEIWHLGIKFKMWSFKKNQMQESSTQKQKLIFTNSTNFILNVILSFQENISNPFTVILSYKAGSHCNHLMSFLILQWLLQTYGSDMTQSFSSRQRQEASMVIPDDFTILTGDMKLEHLSTLHTLNELKRNLKRGGKQGTVTSLIHCNTSV